MCCTAQSRVTAELASTAQHWRSVQSTLSTSQQLDTQTTESKTEPKHCPVDTKVVPRAMSVIVDDGVREEFSKPPPKKKWLADYTHESCDTETTAAALMGSKMMSETQQFVKLLGKQSNEGLRQWKAANTPHKLTLSQNLIGGVVQGVINQFHNFFENDKKEGEAASEEAPESEEQKLSSNEITPVVQSVISQFLNGSLSESGFRRSRKRSHKHINSRSKDKSSSASVSSRTGSVRKSSVIQFSSKAPTISSASAIKVRKIETMLKDDSVGRQTEQALNLSCPKSNPKVTFASEDNCFSSDSVHSFQKSKSMQMFREDYSRKLHESLKLISQPEQDDIEEAPLDLAKKPTPVIIKPNRIQHSPTFAPRLFTSSSSLPVSRQTSPVQEPRKEPRPHFLDESVPVSIIKPKPIKPVLETSNQMLADLYSATKGHSIFSTTADSFKDHKSKALLHNSTDPGLRQNTREVHNRLEKNRRAHLKSCFNELAAECDLDPAKASNLLVIRTAYKCIMGLRREEREQERTMAALVQEKIQRQNRLNELKRQLPGYCSDSDSD